MKDSPSKKYCEVKMFSKDKEKRFIKIFKEGTLTELSLIHISEPTRRTERSRMPSSA